MKENIKIRNLGPIKYLFIEDIRPLTILIGESGSGKSLFMKVLILFRYIYKMLNIRWYLKNANVNKSRFHLKMQSLLSSELAQYFKDKTLEIEYSVEINGRTHKICYKNGELVRNSIDKQIPNEDLLFLKESWISEMRNMIPEWYSPGNNSKINSPRSLRALNFYFQETYNDFLDATEEISSFPLNYLGMEMFVEKKDKSKKFWFRPLDNSYKSMELKFGSSGLQTSSSVMALVDYFSKDFSFKDAIGRSIINYLYETDSLRSFKPQLEPTEMKKMVQIHIEEPELNLFPQAQCKLIEELCQSAYIENGKDRKMSMIMATHSPYIVNYINILLHQKKPGRVKIKEEDVNVYRLYNGALQSLKGYDEKGNVFIDTSDLTEQMEMIMDEYISSINTSEG